MTDPRYPIGKFELPGTLSPARRADALARMAAMPSALHDAVRGLVDAQLDTPYRDGGWTLRQVVHHLADSHLNSYTRFRLALTEEAPTIKPYDEKAWAELPDAKSGALDSSLMLLEGLHARWAALLRSMTAADFARTFVHPERGVMTLEATTRLYAWHCRHHVAHVALCEARR
jgi:uncharacterized damage-inducible protein DinB